MSDRLRDWFSIARTVAREMQARDATLLAASIAYYAFVSLLPTLVLILVVATVVGGPSLRETVLGLAGRYLLPVGQELVGQALVGTSGKGGITLVGLALLLWGALKLFRGVDTAFARIYGTTPHGFLGSVCAGLTVLVAAGAGIGSGLVLVWLAAFLRSPLVGVAPILFVVVLAIVLLPVYYLTPAVRLTLREVLPGAVLGAIGWTLLGTAFAVYAAAATTSGQTALYGTLGAIMLLVTWFYLAGLVLLAGATLNAVLSERAAGQDRQVQHPPERHP